MDLFFRSLSDVVRYVMRSKGFKIIHYFDDYIGVACKSFDCLRQLMQDLGLTISAKSWAIQVHRLSALVS